MNEISLNIKADSRGAIKSSSLNGNLPVTRARVYSLDDRVRFIFGNGHYSGLAAAGKTRELVERGLELAQYHKCNLPEVIENLTEFSETKIPTGWKVTPLNGEYRFEEEISLTPKLLLPIKEFEFYRTTSSIFSLSREELDRIPLPKDFKGEGRQFFIHHARPDEEYMRNWDLYTSSNKEDIPHLCWDIHREYFENVKRVPQIAQAVYKSRPLEDWISKPDKFGTIQLPEEPKKMSLSLATAFLGGEEYVKQLQEITKMRTSLFIDNLMNNPINFRENPRLLNLQLSDGEFAMGFSEKPTQEISNSSFYPSSWIYSNKTYELEEIVRPNFSEFLDYRDQLYFISLFGKLGAKAIFEVVKKYEGVKPC